MIVHESGVETVKTSGVLYSSPQAIRKMAIQLMVSAAECNVDMIGDCPEEYNSKQDIEAVFAHLNEQALDMLEDHIHDLRHNLESFLRNVKFTARVRSIEYDKQGNLDDVTVEVNVE